jgi:hypothetical protein
MKICVLGGRSVDHLLALRLAQCAKTQIVYWVQPKQIKLPMAVQSIELSPDQDWVGVLTRLGVDKVFLTDSQSLVEWGVGNQTYPFDVVGLSPTSLTPKQVIEADVSTDQGSEMVMSLWVSGEQALILGVSELSSSCLEGQSVWVCPPFHFLPQWQAQLMRDVVRPLMRSWNLKEVGYRGFLSVAFSFQQEMEIKGIFFGLLDGHGTAVLSRVRTEKSDALDFLLSKVLLSDVLLTWNTSACACVKVESVTLPSKEVPRDLSLVQSRGKDLVRVFAATSKLAVVRLGDFLKIFDV